MATSNHRAARALALVCLVLAAPVAAHAREGSRFEEAQRSTRGVVTTESRLATEVGLVTLNEGGNAVDAAVAATFAMGVARPELCGIGGGGFMVLRSAGGHAAALDFREESPSDYAFVRGIGLGSPFPMFGTGHGVVGVPGTVAGMAAAMRRFGSMSLAEVIEPARRLAQTGVAVTPALSEAMTTHLPRLRAYETSAEIYLKGGIAPYEPGEILVQEEYARSLALIQRDGRNAFYRGEIAERVAEAMERSGRYPNDQGTMTAADLAAYSAVWRVPIETTYRGRRVITMPAPTSGGLYLAETLNILEGFGLGAMGRSSADATHLIAEAQKIAWADRNAYVGDPDMVAVPAARMTSKEYAAQRRADIDPARARTYEPRAGGPATRTSDPASDLGGHTTHVSVIDARGNAAAVTCTIEQHFGSAVVAAGTGFLLNNQLTDFDDVEGHPNAPAAGKRPRSSTTPAIVAHRGVAEIATGGAGGPTIPGGVLAAITGVVDFGQDLARAVDAERADARGRCGGGLVLCLEQRFEAGVVEELERRGHEVRIGSEYDPPRLYSVGTDLQTGERLAVADPRSGTHPDQGVGMGQPATRPPRRGRPRQRSLRVTVRPARPRAGRVRLRVRVSDAGEPVRRARVRVRRRAARTNRAGVATLRVRLAPGRHRVRVRSRGGLRGSAVLRVRRR